MKRKVKTKPNIDAWDIFIVTMMFIWCGSVIVLTLSVLVYVATIINIMVYGLQ